MNAAGSTRSSGNVFADLGLAAAAERLPKSELAWRIAERIRARGLTQTQAAAELGIDQPRVSDLLNGRLRRFPLTRLLALATAAGLAVAITVAPTEPSTRRGRTVVGGPSGAMATSGSAGEGGRLD